MPPKTIIVNDVEYDIDTLDEETKIILNHITDIDQKVKEATFQQQQLGVSRGAFYNMLLIKLPKPKEEPPTVITETGSGPAVAGEDFKPSDALVSVEPQQDTPADKIA